MENIIGQNRSLSPNEEITISLSESAAKELNVPSGCHIDMPKKVDPKLSSYETILMQDSNPSLFEIFNEEEQISFGRLPSGLQEALKNMATIHCHLDNSHE